MSILQICTFSDSKIFQHLSDFLWFTLSSENSHQLGLSKPTDKFHHSIESWEQWEEGGEWDEEQTI